MKLLLDANLSPRVTTLLHTHGYEAVHVGDEELLTATDDTILDHAGAIVTIARGRLRVRPLPVHTPTE